MFGSHEPVAWCCAPFFQASNHGVTNATVGLPQSSKGQPSMDHNSRFPSSTRHAGHAHGWTELEPQEVVWTHSQRCGSSSWKMLTGKLSLFPNGPVCAITFVNISAIVNQTDGHWTMTGSLKTIFMRSRDVLCLIVIGVRKKKRTQSLITRAVVLLLLHTSYVQQFLFFFDFPQTIYLLGVSNQIFNSLFNSRRLSNWYVGTK